MYSEHRTHILFRPLDGLHLDPQVDHAGEALFRTDRHLDRHRYGAKTVLSCCTTRKKFAPMRSILLTNAMRGTLYLLAWRQTVSDCGCTPPGAQYEYCAIEHAQRTLDLDGEVDVPGGIDDIDTVLGYCRHATPETGRRSRGNGDTTPCSCSIQSMVAAPSCTSPILWETPV